MKQLQEKLLALLLMALLSGTGAYAQEAPDKQETPDKVVVFRFLPGEEMFSLKGNEAELERLYMLVDKHRAEITAGRMPVYVDGYCASLPTAKENLNTAFARANRVKSELITQKGLKEADFITANYARAYHNNKDLVVVTLRIPSAKATSETMPAQEKVKWEEPQQKQVTVEQKTEIAVEKPSEPSTVEQQPAPVSEQRIRETEKPYRFAVRTNLLYDALLLPTLGVEWRINEHVGIKLDGGLTWWGGSSGKVQKMWLVNPEVRRYLWDKKRFYAGISGSYGEYNLYKYMLGGIVSKDTGYQGKLWNAGLTVGYQLYLSRGFSIDFNLGLGYTRSEYDSFGMTDGIRVYKKRNRTKNLWGPTQAGISLVWTIGSK
ncbi:MULTISPECIES: DUF3575 domain-containing protein [Bacteroides]|uniref:DUF3575 domain-containing protein n=1 Tax=Bacteroides TaxID=816 RepID=UPI000517AE44|nr:MULTISPECIES: DUF3575 domain-containing protein [Bacteroides]MCM0365145.1 DUF3575 domain-containing protein [Bacteroides fragilis]MCS2614007.1 DUF3575 domain-containing protein [Bacteroides fragilis]MCS2877437.1 DUF3575 domain-containing protein [Bacteroides fragilis]MCY6342527.1 DUF3575 domain-containing protein [Bacteroides fragilis]MCZ2669578.1 DUF3575 domain-containing protein [Bacteroides fragilis]